MYSVFTLLKVVSYYDLSVLSMSVMGFQKKKLDGGVGGWGELHPSLFWIFGIYLTLQSPLILERLPPHLFLVVSVHHGVESVVGAR